jgi:pyruvate/2-oxoglutarate dehydrogenase complex dihydrolipoamide dehydrogenase (E3) component
VNPQPKPRYNLVVIGGGTAGLVSAAGAAGLGASVALIESHRLGGDCLNFGCVPSKALLRTARAIGDVRAAREVGITGVGEPRVDFAAVMERMRRLRADISPNDSVERFRGLGVDVFLGHARFVAPDRVAVGGHTLNFRRAIIATGTRPSVPDIPGLSAAGYLTNESIFSLTTLPARLAILGAGPIGCELAQAFARFGSRVTLLCKHDTILPHEDRQAGQHIASVLQNDGVEIRYATRTTKVETRSDVRILTTNAGALEVDALLVAAGRTPIIDELGLEVAGVESDPKLGVIVNDRLQTSNSSIFAAGDVCSHYKFTHAADAYARIAIRNALFFGRAKASRLVIPRCLYTDPELAHVGWTEEDAAQAGVPIDTYVMDFAHVDRALLDGEASGFAKLHVKRGTDRIVGGTIVARHAGEMIGELTLAMTAGMGLAALADTIHPYPTQVEALKKLGDAYNRTRLTPVVRWLFGKWFSWNA